MSYPSQKRRLRPARGVAALVAALLAGGVGLAALPSAQAAPAVPGDPGWITTMGGRTVNYQQGGPGTDEVAATASQFSNPRGLAIAPNGDVYITDALNQTVRRIGSDGIVHRVAGTGTACTATTSAKTTPNWCGDGGSALAAQLNEPHGVAVDTAGNVYIADSNNCVIRKVTGGNISTIAGTGAKNGSLNCTPTAGDPSGNASDIALDQPKSIFMTESGGKVTLWVADKGNNQIRMITDAAGANPQSAVVVGNNQRKRYGGDGGDALAAQLRHAQGVWVANDGTMYITDSGNNLVRKVAAPVNGIRVITTIAGDTANANAKALQSDTDIGGDQLPGDSSGDGGKAIDAHFDGPRGITGDNAGNLYVAEEHGSRIRRIRLNAPGGATIDTIAGDGTVVEQRANGGTAYIKGDPSGNGLEAQFAYLHDIQINPADGSLWIADSRNNRVRAIASVATAPGAVVPTGGNPVTTPTTQPPAQVPGGKSGYWMLGDDGKVFAFGDAQGASFGDAVGRIPAGAKAVHIEPTPSFGGYWINDDRGGVYGFGNAAALGGIDASVLNAGEKVTSLSATPSGNGYWLFTSKGRVFPKGDAQKFGDLASVTLNGPIQSSIPTPTGQGYFMVGSDGGVFAFGDAKFVGSMGGFKLNKPVLSLVPTRTNKGYWLVASDGGIFAFGDAGFRGSMGGKPLNKPVVGMVRYGAGYLMVAADGGIFSFSDKPFAGSLGSNPPARPIVFAATLDS